MLSSPSSSPSSSSSSSSSDTNLLPTPETIEKEKLRKSNVQNTVTGVILGILIRNIDIGNIDKENDISNASNSTKTDENKKIIIETTKLNQLS